MKTQNQTVLNHLKSGTITSWDAIVLYKITRLSGRIYDLRDAGHAIETEWIQNGTKRFAKYRLVQS